MKKETVKEIDKTKRRAFLAFCMDALARALSDEDAVEPWLVNGVPDGTFDEVSERDCENIASPYEDVVDGMSDEDWNDMCADWIDVMAKGCYGNVSALGMMVYEDGSII